MKAKISVMPKKEVLDPKGRAVHSSFESIGFLGIDEVRIGKVIEIDFSDSTSKEDAEKRVHEMCDKLLVNAVIEDYTFEIVSG